MSSGRPRGAEARGTGRVPSSSTVSTAGGGDDKATCAQNGEKRKEARGSGDCFMQNQVLLLQACHPVAFPALLRRWSVRNSLQQALLQLSHLSCGETSCFHLADTCNKFIKGWDNNAIIIARDIPWVLAFQGISKGARGAEGCRRRFLHLILAITFQQVFWHPTLPQPKLLHFCVPPVIDPTLLGTPLGP